MVSSEILTLLQEVIGQIKDHSKVKNHSTRRPQAFSPSSALPSGPGMLFLRRNYCTTAIRSILASALYPAQALFRLPRGHQGGHRDPPHL